MESGNDMEKKITEAAKRAFLEKGYLGASMRDIAKAAHVNVAMVNYYFRSKDKLFDIIFLEQLDLMISTIMNNVLEANDLLGKIKLVITNVIDSLNKHPYLPIFVITEINRDPDRFFSAGNFRNVPPALEIFIRQVEDEIKEEKIRPVNPYLLLINIISLCIFPFLAKPIISVVLGVADEDLEKIQEDRKQEIFELIFNRLKV